MSKDKPRREQANDDEVVIFSKFEKKDGINLDRSSKDKAKSKGQAVRSLVKKKQFKKTVIFSFDFFQRRMMKNIRKR